MKRSTLLLALLSVGIVATANPVSRQQAFKNAQCFMAHQKQAVALSDQDAQSKPRKIKGTAAQETAAYYVFNAQNQAGYVIASGSDLVRPVLAYVDNGSFNESAIPPAMQDYLDMYADQIEWAEKNNIQATPAKKMQKHDVDILMTTKWNQTSPYQQYLNISGETIWSPTGCLTTATAQVMNYHKWPAGTTKVIPSYNLTTTITTPELEPVTFEWDLMKDSYSSSDRDTPEGQAVGTLMKYVALATQASLGIASTSTTDCHAAYALKQFFNYDDGVRFLQDWNLTTAEWDSIIYNEVANKRPVIHTGSRFSNSAYGHAFVCDGYREVDSLYHFNWGWGGSSDGWFALDALQPSSIGTGGGSGTGGYNWLRSITVGVQKPDGIPADEVNEVVDQLCMALESETVMHRNSRDEDFGEMRLGVVMWPYDYQNLWYECSMGLYNEDGELVRVYPFEVKNYMKGYSYVNLFSFNIGAELPLGKYELKTVSRLLDSDIYRSTFGADHRRIQLEVKDTELIIKPPYDLTVSNVAVENCTSSSYKQLTYDLTNNSDEDFVGRIYVVYNASTANANYQVNVPAGETIHVKTDKGVTSQSVLSNYAISFDSRRRWSLWNGNSNWANIDYQLAFDHKANSEGKLTGNDVEFTVHITNRGEVPYEKDLTAVLYESDSTVSTGITQTVTATVDPKNNKKFNFKFVDLPEGKTYSLRVTHYESKANTNVTYGPFTTGKGTFIQLAEGDSVVIDGNAVTIPDEALYVDARNSEAIDNITPNNNPNTLYLLPAGTTVPEKLAGKNVVVGNVAQNITMVDGTDFVTPIDFTAQNITYVRTFTRNGDGKNNWETVMLPFAVKSVNDATKTLDWARTADNSDCDLWVMELAGEPTGSELTLDFASAMEAYKPYLIAVNGLAGRELTFTGTDAAITAGKAGVTVNGNYDMIGRAEKTESRYFYLLDEPSNAPATEDGTSAETTSDNKFTLVKAPATVAPFRAYMVNYSQSTPYSALTLLVPGGTQTGVTTITVNEPVRKITGVYTLDGRKVAADDKSLSTLPRGIYIVNGEKYVR
ncbi:MAG: C10 family peptidase [Muribaculaceae bacterium]|nr:C10 family peptidase [Muribaculaceae bacterium]